MIRPFTFLCMLAAVGSGLYLYTEKHSAELLDRQIAHTIRATEAARQRTGLLRAEWALLNEPGRLQTMANDYLSLKPMAPGQFVQLANLATRLPAPLPPSAQPSGGTDDGADDAAAPDAAAKDGAVVANTTPALPLGSTLDSPHPSAADPGIGDVGLAAAKPAAMVKTAHAQQAGKQPGKLVAHLAPKKQPHPVAVADRDADSHDNPLAHSSPLPLATPQPMGARVMSAMARPMRGGHGWGAARPAVVTATPSALSASAYVGSALASHGSLPPPVPMGVQ